MSIHLNDILETFSKIKKTPSSNGKIKLLKSVRSPLLEEVLEYSCSPFKMFGITLGVSDIKKTFDKNTLLEGKRSDRRWKQFTELLDELQGGLSGNDAKKAVKEFLASVPPTYRFWFTAILNKDLDMGVGNKKVEAMYPDIWPRINPMLAKVYEGKFPTSAIIEPKYDGVRCLVRLDKAGKTTVITRNGKPMYNYGHIMRQIESLPKKYRGLLFDGEFYAGSFRATSSITRSQSEHPDRKNLKFFIFDLLTEDEWNAKKCETPLVNRRVKLYDTLRTLQLSISGKIHVFGVQHKFVQNEAEMKDAVKKYLAAGFEGGMLKDMEAVYEFGKRSKGWQKVKPIFEDDFKIIGVEEGTGKFKGMLGALIVKGRTEFAGKKYRIKTNVGGGFTNTQRKDLWKRWHRKKDLKGVYCMVEFGAITEKKDRKDGTYALRFPEFVRLREDK